LLIACLLILATYGLMIDLKGITTDEGMRLAIINGGQAFTPDGPSHDASWAKVLATNSHCAYQPLYFLIQNTLMRLAQTQDVVFFRLVNVFFLWVCLRGLLALSTTWSLLPRLFLLGLFSFNAYLFMHVLQVREYIAGTACYIWSTWVVLRLDRRVLEHPWADRLWFAGYGVLLIAGFYLQSWVVLPAIGQGLFLLVRGRAGRWRFYAHLAFSYAIVLAATIPYLMTHNQKVDVGRWGTETSALAPQLSTGFHLVLAGHQPGQFPFTDFLFWLWLVLVIGAAVSLFRAKNIPGLSDANAEIKRSGFLMLLCIGVSLAFQIGYFYARENLSVWPRYFIIHYFFMTWLVALAFRFLDEWRRHATPVWTRRSLNLAVGALAAVLAASAIFQTHSYYRDPYLDTSFTRASNWRVWTAALSRILQPDDVVISHDYVARSTLTFTRPMAQRVLLLDEVETADLHAAERLVYIELTESPFERAELVARMSALGFPVMQEVWIPSADGTGFVPEWPFLVFKR